MRLWARATIFVPCAPLFKLFCSILFTVCAPLFSLPPMHIHDSRHSDLLPAPTSPPRTARALHLIIAIDRRLRPRLSWSTRVGLVWGKDSSDTRPTRGSHISRGTFILLLLICVDFLLLVYDYLRINTRAFFFNRLPTATMNVAR